MAQQVKGKANRSRKLWSSQRAPGTSLWQLGTLPEMPTTTEAQRQSLAEMSLAIPNIASPISSYSDFSAPDASHTFTQAIDHYVNSIIPSAASLQRLSPIETKRACEGMLQLVSSDDILRTGAIAFSLCTLPRALDPGTATNLSMIHARSQLVEGVRQLMPQGISDRLVYAMVFLMAVDGMLNYSDHARLHVNGMQTILRLKGSLEDLGRLQFGAGNLGDSVCGVLALAHSSMKVEDEPQDANLYLVEVQNSPETMGQICGLPMGLRSLALAGKLSVATINCLTELQHTYLISGTPAPSIFNRGPRLHQPLPWSSTFPRLRTKLERLICITARTVAYDLCPTPNPVRTVLRDPRRYNIDLLEESIWTEENFPCLAWIITVLNATPPWCTDPSCIDLMSRLTRIYPQSRSWQSLSEILGGFLMYNSLHTRWEQLWREFYRMQAQGKG